MHFWRRTRLSASSGEARHGIEQAALAPAILISAFAADPTIPSEPTIGWAFIRSALRAVEGSGIRVIVVTNKRSASVVSEWGSAESKELLDVIGVGLPRWLRWLERPRINAWARVEYLMWYIKACRTVRDICRRNDVLLAHHVTFATEMLPTPITAASSATFKVWGPIGSDGVADVYKIAPTSSGTRREYLIQVTRDKISQIVAPILARRVDLVITSQRGALHRNLTESGIRTATFPNLILPPSLAASIIETRKNVGAVAKSNDSIDIMFVGHLIPRKRVEIAIAALAVPVLSKAQLYCFGNPTGGDLAPYKRLAERLGVADRVSFCGAVDRSVVLEFMCKADVLVHPSGREGAVGVIGEATVAGIPVVCFDGTGASLVLRAGKGSGVTVNATTSGNIEAVASAIQSAASLERGEAADWTTARFDELERVLIEFASSRSNEDGLTGRGSTLPEVNEFAELLWGQN